MRNLTTFPRAIVLRNVADIGQCAVTLDAKGRELAHYPARWNRAIPTMRHATGDAYWIVRMPDGSTYRTATQR